MVSSVPTSSQIVQRIENASEFAVTWGISAGTSLFVLFAVVSILRYLIGARGDGHQATPSAQSGSSSYIPKPTPYVDLSVRMGASPPPPPPSTGTALSERLKH